MCQKYLSGLIKVVPSSPISHGLAVTPTIYNRLSFYNLYLQAVVYGLNSDDRSRSVQWLLNVNS